MTSTKSQTQILLKKIEYVNYALTQDKSDLSVTEFYTIYHQIIDQVKTKSKELDSTYLSKKSSLFPSITLDELHGVKSFEDRQDHSILFQLLLGPLIALFIAIIPTKRKKMMKVFKEKESIILDLNNSIRNVLLPHKSVRMNTIHYMMTKANAYCSLKRNIK